MNPSRFSSPLEGEAGRGGVETAGGGTSGLVKQMLTGDRISVARVITLIENGEPSSHDLLRAIHPHVGKAYRVGITGPAGSGKSTLVNQLALLARKAEIKVGILAVDPTSPFSGGALLGDRIRMVDVASDPAVFIRSMASRGSTGGLARTTGDVLDVLDASGKEIIFVETVGVGQAEIDIMEAVDTVCVVLVPEFGGNLQAMKAGLMEIAHVFALNKADREGAELAREAILEAMSLSSSESGWETGVFLTVATEGRGINDVWERILEHKAFLSEKGQLALNRRRRARQKIQSIVRGRLEDLFLRKKNDLLDRLASQVAEGSLDTYEAASAILETQEIRLESQDLNWSERK